MPQGISSSGAATLGGEGAFFSKGTQQLSWEERERKQEREVKTLRERGREKEREREQARRRAYLHVQTLPKPKKSEETAGGIHCNAL